MKESTDLIGPESQTKQKSRLGQEAGYPFQAPLVCLPPVGHDHYHKDGAWGLSRPHLYQQAGIKLSNYPPRPHAGPNSLL